MTKKGFTLIELLIVVAIIAILAAIAVPNFLEAQTRSRVSRVKADIRTLGTAIESYCIDSGKYPYCYDPYIAGDHYASHCFLKLQWRNNSNFMTGYGNILTTPTSYLADIPWDPFMSIAYRVAPPPGWGWPSIPERCSVMYTYGMHWDFVNDICTAEGVDGVTEPRLYKDAGWASYSCGPNLTLSWPPLVYDPTNGTVSRGMIIYLGKGAGFISRTGFENSPIVYSY